MPALEAPDRDYLESLRRELERAHAPQDQQIDRARQVRELLRPSGLPDDQRLTDIEVRDPTATAESFRVAATLAVNPPKLTVTPTRPGEAPQQRATLRKHWTEAVLKVSGRRDDGPHTFAALVDAVVSDGGGWHKLVLDRDLWEARYSYKRKAFSDDEGYDLDPEKRAKGARSGGEKFDEVTEDAKRAAGPPFRWLSVDARTVYPLFRSGRIMEVLEVQERPESATFRQYRLGRNKDGEIVSEELGEPGSRREAQRHPGSSVTVLEHWDSVFCTLLVLGVTHGGAPTSRLVRQWRHGYGQVPYFYAPGLYMNHWRNRKVGWGVFEAKRFLVEFRSYLWTQMANVASRDALPPIVHVRGPGSAAANNALVGKDGRQLSPARQWRPRQVLEADQGEDYKPLVMPPVAESLKLLHGEVSGAIKDLTSPQVTSLEGLEGAGFAINQVLHEARLQHAPIAQGIERSLVQLTRFLWKLVRLKVKETVWVYGTSKEGPSWMGAGPDELVEDVELEWEISADQPSAELLEGRYHAEQVAAGFESMDMAIEAQGRSPDEVRLGQAMDLIRKTDWYRDLMLTYVAQEVGRGDLVAQAAAQQIAATGVVPGAEEASGAAVAAGQAMAQTGPGGPAQPANVPSAMGAGGVVPDMGNLAASPNGAGAAPQRMPLGPGPGPSAGVSNPPATSVAPGIQRIGSGGGNWLRDWQERADEVEAEFRQQRQGERAETREERDGWGLAA